MEKTFTPSICQPSEGSKEPRYSGTITLKMLAYDERLEIYDSLPENPYDIVPDTETEDEKSQREKNGKTANLKRLKALCKIVPQYIVSIDLVRCSDGFLINKWEHLLYDSDLGSVVTEMGTTLIGKNQVGPQ